jgi:hypothetical protein
MSVFPIVGDVGFDHVIKNESSMGTDIIQRKKDSLEPLLHIK